MPAAVSETFLRECHLLLEEAGTDLLRFRVAGELGVAPEQMMIRQEVALGLPGAFADLRVLAPGHPPQFIEVKVGYDPDRVARHLARKYGGPPAPSALGGHAGRPGLLVIADGVDEAFLRPVVHEYYDLETQSTAKFLGQMREHGIPPTLSLDAEGMRGFRAAIDHAKGRLAFGDAWRDDDLQQALVWHFGHARVRRLLSAHAGSGDRAAAEAIWPRGTFRAVAAVLADLCSFSSYVRDTRDDQIVRDALTSFYAKARAAILNCGGMLLQFVGDEVIGLFGLPEREGDDADRALECARAMLEIGAFRVRALQRNIDQVQAARGVHVGIAVGDVHVLDLQPFSRARLGAVSDAINLGARLLAVAQPGEIVASTSFTRGLSAASQALFDPTEPIEAKNLGRVHAWRLRGTAG